MVSYRWRCWFWLKMHYDGRPLRYFVFWMSGGDKSAPRLVSWPVAKKNTAWQRAMTARMASRSILSVPTPASSDLNYVMNVSPSFCSHSCHTLHHPIPALYPL